ncbi:SPOR domain-containing protein [Pararhodospirillum photometricum]|uniref:SPOR domain-containing protein n=1 Tax=Pararhodospirillum photometricum DSM 122 TaxID=1150469 RepID=H6SR20_PARPM|nr:SPOR domain-containing protein [Pararhodospirillum photometricum]CCG09742.1 Putative uncharacterized protein [Pararhodospirillum photometricum DSM 122]
MTGKQVSLALVAVVLAGCAREETPEETHATEETASPRVEETGPGVALPLYAVGDTYTFDNPREVWTVSGFDDKGRVVWRSDLGAERITALDPLLPSLRQATPQGLSVARIVHRETDFFPLRPGARTTFSEAIGLNEPPFTQSFKWTCTAEASTSLEVPAGRFEVYPVACDRDDGLRVTAFYAPSVGYVVRRALSRQGQTLEERSLLAFANQAQGPVASGIAQATLAAPQAKLAKAPSVAPVVAAVPLPSQPLPSQPLPSQPLSSQSPPAVPPKTTLVAGATATPKALPAPEAPKPAADAPADDLGLQLAAFRTEAGARRGWGEMMERHPDLLAGLKPAIRTVDLPGKGVFFRVFAHPIDRSRAHDLCGKIEDLKVHCHITALE